MTTLLRLPRVIERTGLGRSALYERIKDGLLPTPIKQGKRVSVWPEHEIDACNDARIRGADDGAIRELVTALLERRAA